MEKKKIFIYDYDVIVVGAGFAGSIMAYKLATDQNKKVLVIEKRNHIAGNMYDYKDENGIRIQKYGPHTFHTNIDDVYKFITKFCELKKYKLKCQAVIDEICTPTPFNFKTIDQFYSPEEASKLKYTLLDYYNIEKATVLEMLNCEVDSIRNYAKFLFDKDYSLYTAKQWGKKPSEIDPSILSRVPVIFNYRDTYFEDKYEGVPKNGFTEIFEKMLNNNNITVEFNVNALDKIGIDENNGYITYEGINIPIIYTGAIDELFNYKYGNLPYRSLEFEYKYYNKKSYQDVAIVAHPENVPYTRITEYTKLPYQDVGEKTVVALEYPMHYDKNSTNGNEPYYPVLTEESQKQYDNYYTYSKKFKNLILCGRLADFKYYNMDQVIYRTLKLYEKEFTKN